jgi:hypothetical protein
MSELTAESIEKEAVESWNRGVEDNWREWPNHMQLLKEYGCGFGFDDVTGAYHLETEENGSCGIVIYHYISDQYGWSVGRCYNGEWKHHYKLNSFELFRQQLRQVRKLFPYCVKADNKKFHEES